MAEEAPGAADPVAGAAAVRLGRLPIELVMLLPHPAASNPAARTATTAENVVAERRMLIPPQCARHAARACAAGDTDVYQAGHPARGG